MESRKLSCTQAVQQFFVYLDNALKGDDVADLEAHLEACLDCCERLEFSRKLDALVRTRLAGASLPEGIEQRIRRTLAG